MATLSFRASVSYLQNKSNEHNAGDQKQREELPVTGAGTEQAFKPTWPEPLLSPPDLRETHKVFPPDILAVGGGTFTWLQPVIPNR